MADQHLTHHEEEFGVVKHGIVNIETHRGKLGSGLDSPSGTEVARQVVRLRRGLFKRRYLKQYFLGKVLYRTDQPRPITTDELFLDLILVANIAAIGHELRETFKGWFEVEKFMLLFAAITNVWRAISLFWNMFGAEADVSDKLFVGLEFFLLTMIGVGAHEAFDKCLPYVAAGAFFGTVVPYVAMGFFSYREQLLNCKHNLINHGIFNSVLGIAAALPYFAAMFVKNERVARILFWIPVGLQLIASSVGHNIYHWIHRAPEREGKASFAVHIELMIEKFQVFTLIVLGESLLALLFEAAKFVSKEGARIGLLYGATLGAVAIVASFQLLYVNVDNNIMKQSTHAIRHNATFGLLWTQIHMLYHACLIFVATGIGIMFRDIIIDPNSLKGSAQAVLRAVVRAPVETPSAASGPEFAPRSVERWLFSGGWGGALLLSAVLSLLHQRGPREKTKMFRMVSRFAIAIGLGVGMPFADVSEGIYLLVHSLVICIMSLLEFMLVSADGVNLLKKRNNGARNENGEDENSEDADDEFEVPDDTDGLVSDKQDPASADPEAVDQRMNEDPSKRFLRLRMKSRNKGIKMVECQAGSKQCTGDF